MERLLILMGSLPHELQDLISEYNVEHRPKMKNVLSELTKYEINRGICEGCDIGKIGIPLYTLCPFKFICSKKCIKLYVSFIPDGCPDKSYYEELSRKYAC
jgi:hypothetical protein